ncbi:hypothetical protein Tco_0320859 [Tanacetum coccineum]
MAALKYRDEHNKVGYLQKPTGSDDYHQILDFFRASHITYALTNDHIIFDSLVKQFWSTATLRSPELGPPAILATIDETPYTITEDSVRSQLQLADDGGIDDLPIAEIYSGMDNLGFLQTILGIETSLTRQYQVFKLSSKLFANMKLNFEGQPMQLLAAMLPQDQEGEGAGVAAQAVPPPIPEPIPEPMPEPEQPQDHLSTPPRQQTPPASPPSPPRSTQAPPAGHTSGGAEDLITLTVVSSVVSTLVQKVNSLETELKAHKKLFKDVVGKLVKKVKAMEVKLKTKKRKVVVSDSDQEEGGEQAVDLDALIALANAAVTVDSNIPPGGASNNPAASSHIPTDVPTGGDFAPAHSTSPSRDPFKGKGVAKPSSPVSERTKKQLADERLSEIEAARLEALERERSEKEKAEIARQDAIYAKQLEQEEEMSASQRGPDSRGFLSLQSIILMQLDDIHGSNTSKKQKSTEAPIPFVPDVPQPPMTDQSTKHFTTLREILHMVDRQDLLKLYGMVVTYYENRLVTGAGLMLWGDLQVLIDSQEGGKGSFVWNHQSLWQIRSWRLYTLSNVHVLETVSGKVLYMFARCILSSLSEAHGKDAKAQVGD